MTVSAIAFYTVNVMVVFGYLVAIALMSRQRGLTGRGRLPLRYRVPAVIFFTCCVGIHTELAIHAFTGRPIIDATGRIDWHFLAIVTIKAGATYAFLVASLIAARGEVPLSPNISAGLDTSRGDTARDDTDTGDDTDTDADTDTGADGADDRRRVE